MALNPIGPAEIEFYERRINLAPLTAWEIETIMNLDAVVRAGVSKATTPSAGESAMIPAGDTKAMRSALSGMAAARKKS